jgi:hypothetical protein
MTFKDRIVDAAFNRAIASIQDALSITDGGWASMWFSGDREEQMLKLLGDYYDSEIKLAAEDPDQ